jgi:hypothetical protein
MENDKQEQKSGFEVKLTYWHEMRDLISHEDTLVNHRFSWLLTYQGFLMGGFFLVQSAIADDKLTVPMILGVEVFLLVVMLCSMWICFITGQNISAAQRQATSVYRTWIRRYPEENWPTFPLPRWFWPFSRLSLSAINDPDEPPQGSEFPPLRGYFNYHSLGHTARIPFILCLINLLAAVACLVISWMAWRHGAAISLKLHS